MGTAIDCAWCGKPLLDVEHARKHVAEDCTQAPWATELKIARRFLAVHGWAHWPTEEQIVAMERGLAEHMEHVRANAAAKLNLG